jgi:hypothetical protein
VVPVDPDVPRPVPADPLTPFEVPLPQVPVVPVPAAPPLPLGEIGWAGVIGEGDDGVMVPPAAPVVPVVVPVPVVPIVLRPFSVPLPDIGGVVVVPLRLLGVTVVLVELPTVPLPEVPAPVPMLCAYAPPAASMAASMKVDFFMIVLLR